MKLHSLPTNIRQALNLLKSKAKITIKNPQETEGFFCYF
jgi:hypothetical protein